MFLEGPGSSAALLVMVEFITAAQEGLLGVPWWSMPPPCSALQAAEEHASISEQRMCNIGLTRAKQEAVMSQDLVCVDTKEEVTACRQQTIASQA
jgi:hypothetical protein